MVLVKYIGLKTIETEGIHRDYIEIAYAGTDKLFLPTKQSRSVTKYIGNEGDVPRIHKMGGRDWAKVVTKAKKSIDDLADKLVEIYAQREITEGFAFCQINHGSKSLKMPSLMKKQKTNYRLQLKSRHPWKNLFLWIAC